METREPSPCLSTLVPLYDNSDSVCGITYNGISYFFLKNLQGDIIAITNYDGDTVARYSYDAWGKCIIEYDSTGYIANINPFRYRGYYFDNETNLYYLNSRYYDANTGRFINVDSPEYVSIQGGNLFAYGGNCPTKNADHFGFCYVPTYPETYIPSYSSPSYSYGNKKKEDGIIETFLKVLGGIVGIVSIFAASIIMDIRRFLNNNPWIEKTLSIITLILFIAAILVLCIGASGMVAAIILGAAAVAKTIDNIITVVTFDPKSIGDYISLIISLIIPKVVTKGFTSLSKLKIPEKVKELLSNKKIKDFVSDAISKIYDIFS